MKILIYGSCVSRDIFEYPENNGAEIVGYYARSSLASAFSKPADLNIDGYDISSAFQKRMLQCDLAKTLREKIVETDFDVLLVDFIDERFSVAELTPGSIVTISAEFITWVHPTYRVLPEMNIPSGSPRHRELWLEGFNRFVQTLREAGKLDRLVINRVHWASTLDDGRGLPGNYSREFIEKTNAFLDWMYLQASLASDEIKFIDYEEKIFVSSSKHRWGVSPFHYIDDYYIEAFDGIFRVMGADFLTRTLRDDAGEGRHQLINAINQLYSRRLVTWLEAFTFSSDDSYPLSTRVRVNADTILTSGTHKLEEQGLVASFTSDYGAHILNIGLEKPMTADGLTVTFRISGWSEVRYLAVGLMSNNNFRHVKLVHPPVGEWIKVCFSVNDLVYRVHNSDPVSPSDESQSLRIYIKGGAGGEGAAVEVANFLLWNARDDDYPIFSDATGSSLSEIWKTGRFLEVFNESHPIVGKAVEKYLKSVYPKFGELAALHLATGKAPFQGEILADWKLGEYQPEFEGLAPITRYQWHCLHLASMLHLAYNESGESGALLAARAMIEERLGAYLWGDGSADKFYWHDRATAERQLALLYAYHTARERKLDPRYQAHLATALLDHGLLLESEAFYSYLQTTRYHKHAWMQDIALIATGLALPQYLGSPEWIRKGVGRLQELIRRIIFYEEKTDQNLQIAKDKTSDFTNMLYLTSELSRAITIENTISDNLDRIIETL